VDIHFRVTCLTLISIHYITQEWKFKPHFYPKSLQHIVLSQLVNGNLLQNNQHHIGNYVKSKCVFAFTL